MSVVVRPADKKGDFPAIIDGARDFVARIGKPFLYPAEPDEFEAALRRIIDLNVVEVHLAQQGERVVGGLGLFIAPFAWNPDRLLAEEIFFWCAGDAPPVTALKLLRVGLASAKTRGSSHFMMHAMSTSPAKFHDVLKRLGFEPLQSSYIKVC